MEEAWREAGNCLWPSSHSQEPLPHPQNSQAAKAELEACTLQADFQKLWRGPGLLALRGTTPTCRPNPLRGTRTGQLFPGQALGLRPEDRFWPGLLQA